MDEDEQLARAIAASLGQDDYESHPSALERSPKPIYDGQSLPTRAARPQQQQIGQLGAHVSSSAQQPQGIQTSLRLADCGGRRTCSDRLWCLRKIV